MKIGKFLTVIVAVLALAVPHSMSTQTGNDEGAKNAAKARAALDAMVKALGGSAWLNMQNQEREGHIAAFFQGNPDPGTTEYFEFHQWPDHDRIEFTKHRDVVQFFIARQGFEVTYKGKHVLEKDIVDDYMRRRDHSIETAVKVWMKDPNTILIYEGQHLAERHLAEQVTLISPQNEAITILMDEQTHLPLRRTFQWRDPQLPRQEHRRRGVRRLPRHPGFPYPIHHQPIQERRHDPPVLHQQSELQPESARGFLGCGRRLHAGSRSSRAGQDEQLSVHSRRGDIYNPEERKAYKATVP